MTQPSLYDVVRYARNAESFSEGGKKKFNPLIGEEPGLLTVFSGFGMARRPTIVYAFSGTGKTVLADAVWALLPDQRKHVVDMVSAKALWYKADEINAAVFLYFPEEQNASDNDEVVKIKKKFGEGKDAEREVTGGILGEGMGRSIQKSKLNWHPTLSTMAIGNSKGEQVFDEEQARRQIIVTTDPTSRQTSRVLARQSDIWALGAEKVRDMDMGEILGLKLHVAACVSQYDAIKDVRFFGARAFQKQIPTVFTASRSAYPLLQAVARGVGIYYHKSEQVVDGTLLLSPARFAETLDFYGDIFYANCMKLPPLGGKVLQALPKPALNDHGIVGHESMKTEAQLVERLVTNGHVIERTKVRAILKRLVDGGYIEENAELQTKRYFRTPLSDAQSNVDWPAIITDARKVARDYLGNEKGDEWSARYAPDTVEFISPMTGECRSVGKVSA